MNMKSTFDIVQTVLKRGIFDLPNEKKQFCLRSKENKWNLEEDFNVFRQILYQLHVKFCFNLILWQRMESNVIF